MNNFKKLHFFSVIFILTFTELIMVSLACGGTALPVLVATVTHAMTLESPTQPASNSQILQRDFTLPTPLFASDSPWNQKVTGAKVSSKSDKQILVTYCVLRGDTSTLSPRTTVPYWPFMSVNYDEYAIPVFRMGTEQETVMIRDYEGKKSWSNPKLPIDQAGGPVKVPAPAGTVRPAGPENTDADGHLVLYNPNTFEEYDFWQATTVRTKKGKTLGGGQTGTKILEAGAVDFFDVRESGTNPSTYSSARAVGTPLLAGMILPEDIESWNISHALAFTIPGPRNTSKKPAKPLSSDYFYPASTTETDFYNTNPNALASGQRIRLKEEIVDDKGNLIDENQLAPITRMFITALRTYGAYLVDNAGGFSFSAEDIHTATLNLSDDEINTLIGKPADTLLPSGKTKWQIVIEKLNEELEQIPIAYGPWENGQNPAKAKIETANFEVVEPKATSWNSVNDFVYQLQGIDLTAIGDTKIDLVIIDYSADGSESGRFSAKEIDALKNNAKGSKLVLAYMSIGEAENYRWYWDKKWDTDNDGIPDSGAPSWLEQSNPDWIGNYKVKYWDPEWQSIIYDSATSYLDKIIETGFDGVYLDIIDAYEYWGPGGESGQNRETAKQEMVEFVIAISEYAKSKNSNFGIFPQNGAPLGAYKDYLNAVTGIGQEDIYYGYDGDGQKTPKNIIKELEGYLDVFKNAGKLVLTINYPFSCSEDKPCFNKKTKKKINSAYKESSRKGYIPYCTVRNLNYLTINPGH